MTLAEQYVAGDLDPDEITVPVRFEFPSFALANGAANEGRITAEELAPLMEIQQKFLDESAAVRASNDAAVEAAIENGDDPDEVEPLPYPDAPPADSWVIERDEPLAQHVQRIADETQSYAYRFEDLDDGSRLEVKASATPHVKAPDGEPDLPASIATHGFLAQTDEGELLRVWNMNEGNEMLDPDFQWGPADPQTVRFHDHTPTDGPVVLVAHPPQA